LIETITKRRKLKPRKTPYWDKVAVGKFIGFYRSDDGGTWHARTLIDGKRYFQPIGGDMDSDYEDMLKEAQAWFEEMRKVEKPESANHTIKSVVEDYISYLEVEKPNKDTAYRTRLQLEKHLIPTLGKIMLKDLTTLRFRKWRDSMVKGPKHKDVIKEPDELEQAEITRRSKDSANRVLSMAKAAFNLAFKEGAVPSDIAWKRVSSFEGVGANRQLFLNTRQVNSLLKKTEGGLHNLIQAGIYTGARAGELTALLVRDFDPKEGTLHIDGKTGKRITYLSKTAITFFKDQAEGKKNNGYIFIEDNGEPWKVDNYQRPFRAAVGAAKLPKETVFYSLRHYHISKALKANIPPQIVAENCGTSVRMLEKHYAKFMATDRRRMFNKVAL